MLAGIVLGHFFQVGRAEPAAFAAIRPGLLLLLVLVVRKRHIGLRWAIFAGALLVALAGEQMLLARLDGGFDPTGLVFQFLWGILLAGVLDGTLRIASRWHRLAGIVLAILVAIGAILSDPVERSARVLQAWSAARETTPALRPPLVIVTGLPLMRGEGDIADMLGGRARPAAIWRWLDAHFAVRPVDLVTPAALRGQGLLLLAQPRALQPVELVAIDDWVRGGGRALVLADPALRWPSLYPPGDSRAPPPISLLDPLLARWGVRLDLAGKATVRRDIVAAGRRWRLAVESPGAFVAIGHRCTVESQGLVARCAPGKGRVLLVADADLAADRLWQANGTRLADNGPLLGAWLDGIAGISRDRSADAIRWIPLGSSRPTALVIGMVPSAVALFLGLLNLFLLRRRGA